MAIPFRFIHAADLHIDSPFKGLTTVPAYVRESLLEATFLAFKRLIDTAIKQQVQFIVVSGDLFDESDRSLKAQLFLLQQYERLRKCQINIYIIHGNHDHLAGQTIPFPYPDNVYVFSSTEVTTKVVTNDDGAILAYVHGISYPTRHVMDNLAKEYKHEPEHGYHIGLYHGNVGNVSEHDPYAPCHLSDLLAHQYHYWALGHIHKRQVLHQSPYVVYPGNTQGRHRKESGDKGCYLVTVNEQHETTIHFLSLAPIRWLQIAIDVSSIENEAQFLATIEHHTSTLLAEQIECSILLSIELTGSGYIHELLQQTGNTRQMLTHIQSMYEDDSSSEWLYIYELQLHTQVQYDEALLRQEQSFIGDFLTYYEQLIVDPEQMKQLFAEAQQGLITHQGLSRYLRQTASTQDKVTLDETSQQAQLADAKQKVLEWLLLHQDQGVSI
ncbi:MAG: DNA repair exonuclease [Candidatus Pristimantibacillus lignocellulolyticus]|uniref:DNA repair exonuclease n=1 Tax=Candidatus Pristimantibacillus lignocellulolyticus TaxID=2994561 RepID=A0A9J6ZAI8_9BACL|nr:MAG: DNA repair exonuclease [Candidatus Pristimantibacillus lignocellulolyticus]